MEGSDQDNTESEAASLHQQPDTSSISIFLRVKPVARPTARIVLEPLDGNVEFRVPRDAAAGCAMEVVIGSFMYRSQLSQHQGRLLLQASQQQQGAVLLQL